VATEALLPRWVLISAAAVGLLLSSFAAYWPAAMFCIISMLLKSNEVDEGVGSIGTGGYVSY